MPLLSGAGSTNTAPTIYPEYPVSTQGLHSPHVTSHVHPNLLKQTIHYNRRMSEYRPVIFISSGRLHVRSIYITNDHCPLYTNWILHQYICLSLILMACFVNNSIFLPCIRLTCVSVRTIVQSIITSVVSAQRRSH